MRRNNINAMLIVVVTAFACILPACGGGGGGSAPAVNECSSVTYQAPSGTANNIVFTFDQPYVCGQYANGDWWVAPLTTGGTVTINSITPTLVDRTPGHIRNGAEVNPSSSTKQGFDTDSPGGTYDATRTAVLPLVINTTTTPISSVVKAASIAGIAAGNNPQLQFAAVLTVVDSSVDRSGKFRPSYFGTNKISVDVSSINVSNLGLVDMTAISAVAAYTFASVADASARIQLDHIIHYYGQYIHAYDNSYANTGYGSEVSIFYAKQMLRFASNDFNYGNSTHKQALINYLQNCIDLAGNVQGGTIYPGEGGYGYGRKLPLLFAGAVLNNATITALASSGTFAEDDSIYTSTRTGVVLHGEVSIFGYTYPDNWFYEAATGNGSKTVRDTMQWVDGGSLSGGSYLMSTVAAPLRYHTVAAQMLGFSANAKFKELLLISNRIEYHGLQYTPDPYAPFDNVPNKNFTWGENPATPGYFFTGAGRYPLKDGKTVPITHKDTMGEAVWTNWILGHDNVPPATISDLAVAPGSALNSLSWSASAGAHHYDIYRATDSALLVSSYLGTATLTIYTDSGLTPGITYAYWVVAVDAAGNVSNMSNKVSGTSL